MPACSGDDDPGSAGGPITVTATGDVPNYDSIVEFKGRLFGIAGDVVARQRLVSSEDGVEWVPVDLDPPAVADGTGSGNVNFGIRGPVAHAGVLTITARGLEPMDIGGDDFEAELGPLYVWTTSDGDRWQAVPVIADPPPIVQPDVGEADGVLFLGGASQDGAFHLLRREASTDWEEVATPLPVASGSAVLAGVWVEAGELTGLVDYPNSLDGEPKPDPTRIRSTDGGRNWSVEPCPPDAQSPCRVGAAAYDGILVAWNRTSTDGGETWTEVAVRPPVDENCERPGLGSVVAVDGGWIAVGQASSGGGPLENQLLRSTDGITWDLVSPDRCPGTGGASTYTTPMEFDGRLWTLRTDATENSPTRSDVMESQDAGSSWQRHPFPLSDDEFPGAPVVVEGQLLVPVFGPGGLVELRGVAE